ncbi:MAG: hypothetical protein JXA13_02690 [Anaerolineales bacterium]|nr:hypothetical protein [Anaerolineales bacterium]
MKEKFERSIVENALRSYPLAETPPDLPRLVLQRIQKMPRQATFRLFWLDWALGIFLAAVLSFGVLALRHVPPVLQNQLYIHWLQFWQKIRLARINESFVLAAFCGFLIVMVWLIWANRPEQRKLR